jgi:conjugal transfer/entry exclusion protein
MTNLAQIKEKLDQKNQKLNQLLGQKEALLENLKELGFSSVKEAEEELTKLETALSKKNKDYKENVELFLETYSDLLKD